jgi:hypothetical protein
MRSFQVDVVMRDGVITDNAQAEEDPITPGWVEVVGDRVLSDVTFAMFDVAEEVIASFVFRGGSCLVQIAQSERPSEIVYEGGDPRLAELHFWNALTKHARDM